MIKSCMVAACALAAMFCATNVAIADNSKPASESVPSAALDRSCLQQTGTRIPVKSQECSGFGRNISKREIDQTGASSVSGAFRLLGPPVH